MSNGLLQTASTHANERVLSQKGRDRQPVQQPRVVNSLGLHPLMLSSHGVTQPVQQLSLMNKAFPPSSKTLLFAADRDHYRKLQLSKCREHVTMEGPTPADTSETQHDIQGSGNIKKDGA